VDITCSPLNPCAATYVAAATSSISDRIITGELCWLLAGSVIWILTYRPLTGRTWQSTFVASAGTIVAWPVAVWALAKAARRGWR
jgi:hypothetical protein